MNDLLKAAERCEQATRSDESLNWEIFRALGYGPHRVGVTTVWRNAIGDEWLATSESVPDYTSSLDAAMMLAPEGQAVELVTGAARLSDARVGRKHNGLGKTPALALCAAALRARDACKQAALCEHGHTDLMSSCNQCSAREIEGRA
jgi:hypothetical protein